MSLKRARVEMEQGITPVSLHTMTGGDVEVTTRPQTSKLVVFDTRDCDQQLSNRMSYISNQFNGVFDKASRIRLLRVWSMAPQTYIVPYHATIVNATTVIAGTPTNYTFTLQRSACTTPANLVTEFNTKADAALGVGVLVLATFPVGSQHRFTLTFTAGVGTDTCTVFGPFIARGASVHGLIASRRTPAPVTSIEIAGGGGVFSGGICDAVQSRGYLLASRVLDRLTYTGGTGNTSFTPYVVLTQLGIYEPPRSATSFCSRSLMGSQLDFTLYDEWGYPVQTADIDQDGNVLPVDSSYLVVEMEVMQESFDDTTRVGI